MPLYSIGTRFTKSSTGLVISSVANFAFCCGLYSKLFRSRVKISLFPFSPFIFLKKPCLVLLPSHLFSIILVINSGSLNKSFCSSFGQLSLTPLATRANVSKPTTSAVLKVADFGLPKTGPVSLSTSSIVSPIS